MLNGAVATLSSGRLSPVHPPCGSPAVGWKGVRLQPELLGWAVTPLAAQQPRVCAHAALFPVGPLSAARPSFGLKPGDPLWVRLAVPLPLCYLVLSALGPCSGEAVLATRIVVSPSRPLCTCAWPPESLR